MARGVNLDFEPVPDVGSVIPTGGNPYARQNIQANPAAFGAPQAKALETLGQGFERASEAGFSAYKFFQDVATDQQVNNFIQSRTQIEYGMPGKTISGPDGQQQPDTGYFGTIGQTALNSRTNALQAIEEARQNGLKNLTSDYARQRFETETRRMYADSEMRMSRHADEQFKTYTQSVNAAGADINLNAMAAAIASGHMNEADAAQERYIDAKVKLAQSKYGFDSTITQDAITDAKRDALETRLNALAVKNPAQALQLLDKNKGVAGTRYDDIYNRLRSRADEQIGDQAAQRALQNVRGGGFAPSVNAAIADAARITGVNPALLTRFAQVESGGNPWATTGSYKGLTQQSTEEFRKYGPPGGNIFNPRDNAIAAGNKIKADAQQFEAKTGIHPHAFDSYMIWQQGLAGYEHHLSRPDAPAWLNMEAASQKSEGWAKKAIWGNIPDQYKHYFGNVDNVTSRDFLQMWQHKFGQGGSAVSVAPQQQGATPVASRITPQWDFPPEETLYGTQGRGNFEPAPFVQPQQRQPTIAGTIRPNAMASLLEDPELQNNPKAFARAHSQVAMALQTQEIAEGENAKLRKEAALSTADQYVTKLAEAMHKPGSDLVALYGEVAHNPDLDYETRKGLLDRISKYSGEEQEIGYGPGYTDAYRRILSPAGTPGHIGKIEDIFNLPPDSVRSEGLSKLVSTFKTLKQEKSAASGEAEMIKNFLEGAERYVSGEGLYAGMKDPKGRLIFEHFLGTFYHDYDKGKEEGKTPAQLLDPESKDYVGKSLKSMQRPMEEWFKDIVQNNSEASPAAVPAEPSSPGLLSRAVGAVSNALAPLESWRGEPTLTLDNVKEAYRSGRMDYPTAARIIIQNGWGRQSQARLPMAPPPELPMSR